MSDSKDAKNTHEKDEVDVLPDPKRIELYNGLGFVALIDVMPKMVPKGRTVDIAVSRNARVSYQMGDKTKKADETLVRYLMECRHTSPFESIIFKFHIRLPIFVERQLIRHRTASVNEASYRYSEAKDEYYFPELRLQSATNKQGSSDEKADAEAEALWKKMQDLSKEAHKTYEALLAKGVSRELARIGLPVGLMTEGIWTINLHNLFHLLGLRMPTEAQKEIRDLAWAMFELIQPIAPIACDAWFNTQFKSIRFAADEIELIASGASFDSLGPRRAAQLTKKIAALKMVKK